jgi:hypothetical protein
LAICSRKIGNIIRGLKQANAGLWRRGLVRPSVPHARALRFARAPLRLAA